MLGFFRSHSSSSFSLSLSSFSLIAPNHTGFLPSSPCFLICGTIFVSSSLIFHRLFPCCFRNPFREKVHFFGPFWGSYTSRILFLLGQWGHIFLKLRPQFLLSWGDWFRVKECSWRRRCCVLVTISSSLKGVV